MVSLVVRGPPQLPPQGHRRQFDAGGDQTSCRRSRDAAKNMYTTRRATIGHFLHHSGHGPCDDGPSIRPASSYRVKSSKRVLSSGDYFYFCNRKNKLVGGRIYILWIDYDPKSILKFLVFWDTERHTKKTTSSSGGVYGCFVFACIFPLDSSKYLCLRVRKRVSPLRRYKSS